MFEHGIARAGYIEVPRDPDLAFEFLQVEWRTIQHYGEKIGSRRYDGTVLDAYRNQRSAPCHSMRIPEKPPATTACYAIRAENLYTLAGAGPCPGLTGAAAKAGVHRPGPGRGQHRLCLEGGQMAAAGTAGQDTTTPAAGAL
jgi:hypothetical protein